MPVRYDVEKIGSGMRIKLAVMSGWFGDLSHTDMVRQVHAYGFPAFENLGAGQWEDRKDVGAVCRELGVAVGAISCGGTITEDGPVNPDYHATFEASVKAAIEAARDLGSTTLLALTGAQRADMSLEQQMENVAVASRRVAPYLEDAGMTMVYETLNTKVNHAGYALVTSKQGADLVDAIGCPNVKFLFDVYHQQISEGDVCRNISTYADRIGHYHFGDNPGRHEPGTGELNYRKIFQTIAETGYQGIVSSEFSKTKEVTVEQLLHILADVATW